MAYEVRFTEQAALDIEEYAAYIASMQGGSEPAWRWAEGLRKEAETLADFPKRVPLVPEQARFAFEVRQIHYASHRLIYRVHEADGVVEVLRVYHQSRRLLRSDDVV